MCCPSNCICFIQPCSTGVARLHIHKWCKHCINFQFWSCNYSCVTSQYRHAFCATVLQRQCGVHCLTGTHGSWAVIQMRVGFYFCFSYGFAPMQFHGQDYCAHSHSSLSCAYLCVVTPFSLCQLLSHV